MLCYRVAGFILLSLLFGNVLVEAQTPRAAVNYYERGNKRLYAGELEEAIGDFTKAIEISSRLGPANHRTDNPLSGRNSLVASDGDADRITVIDPLTANAYTSRGVARYRKGDIDGAVADFDRAISIRPGMAEAYLNRGCARYTRGDTTGALSDWNRAIQIDSKLVAAL